MKSLALLLIAFLMLFVPVLPSGAATCNLSKVHIAGGALTANTEKVLITTTPSCWSGPVEVNQGNRDFNLITVLVTHGQGSGTVPRMEMTGACAIYCIHPYATGPGVRGNNIFITPN